MNNMIFDTEVYRGNSADYTIDLIKKEDGELLVDIYQSGDGIKSSLKQIPMSDLSGLIAELQHFYAIMNVVKPSVASISTKEREIK